MGRGWGQRAVRPAEAEVGLCPGMGGARGFLGVGAGPWQGLVRVTAGSGWKGLGVGCGLE